MWKIYKKKTFFAFKGKVWLSLTRFFMKLTTAEWHQMEISCIDCRQS